VYCKRVAYKNVVAYKKLEQENHHFYQENRIFLNFGPLVRLEETNIFENFFMVF